MSLGIGIGLFLRSLGGSSVWSPTYTLLDQFITNEAAPMASPRTCEPGPGMLNIVDTGNNLSIAANRLTAAPGVGNGDPGIYIPATLSRAAGRSLFATVQLSGAGNAWWGWSLATSIALGEGTLFFRSTANIYHASTTTQLMPYANSVDYKIGSILRSNGDFLVIKGGAFTEWTLLWVAYGFTTANLYAGFGGASVGANRLTDNLRIVDLPVPFDTDYGISTQRLAGARSAGDTFTHEANCLIEFTETTRPTGGQTEVFIRQQDASNYWQVTVDSAGNLDLDEVVAGVPTQRGTAAGVIANGDRIVVIADGTTFRVYEANTLRITYAAAVNFATETDGKLNDEGTAGSVSDIVAYPRVFSGAALTILEAA